MASSKAGLVSIVLLRFMTLAALAGSIVVLFLDKLTLDDGSKFTFKDIIAYRYVLATAAVGFVYTIIQIPFAIYHAIKEKRVFKNQFLPEFDFYADKVCLFVFFFFLRGMVAFLLATGVGAGFALTFELKKFVKDFFDSIKNLGIPGIDESDSALNKFLDKALFATGLLFLGFLCMAVLSIFSSINKITKNSSSSKSNRGCFD
ncbi:hypothetical protein EZV62_018321 [Acer yangbiense]|uniref:CASP-like protein n=1 Tax=Acer yangbiense TaxID=1000413 RepID=A0A5C7HJG0_9ROSI|nr:hypothetical protein EZV62_018321 [Acer yangbiense]